MCMDAGQGRAEQGAGTYLLDHGQEVSVDLAQKRLHLFVLGVLLVLSVTVAALSLCCLLSLNLPLPRLEVLLLLHLAFKHQVDGLALARLRSGKGLADLEEGNGALHVTHRDELAALLQRALHGNAGEHGVANLVRVGNFVLPIEVIPDVDYAVHTRDVKDARPCG